MMFPSRGWRRLLWLLAGLLPPVLGGSAEHVVVIVCDGLRPDFVTTQYMPALQELAARGTFFKNHHSTFISSTEVNGTALATGAYPAHSGVLANSQYRPDLAWLNPFGTESLDAIRRADLISGGNYLGVATLAEVLQQAGIRTFTAGAKPVVLLQDRSAAKTSQVQKESVTLFRGLSLPQSVIKSLVKIPEIGLFPEEPTAETKEEKIVKWIRTARDKVLTWINGKPKTPPIARLIDDWTTRALIHGLWKDGIPKFTLLWLSEPDAAQHASGVGSANAEAGMENTDKNIARVLQALKDKGVSERTDIMVVSDHGFSTIDRGPDVIRALKRASFSASKQFQNPDVGDILVVSLGGSTAFYVFDHHEPTIRKLVEFLQTSDFAGVLFTSVAMEGTFPLSSVKLDAPKGTPDVLVSMRWRRDANEWGAPGLVTAADGSRGKGTHASLSWFDLHNTLVAAGPDFRTNHINEVPSGNVDVAPTVLSILGVPIPGSMDGRPLLEAFATTKTPLPAVRQETIEATRDLGRQVWRQSLTFSQVGSVIYFEEGNGESRVK